MAADLRGPRPATSRLPGWWRTFLRQALNSEPSSGRGLRRPLGG